MQQPRTALIAGTTGLVGSHCLQQLLTSERYKTIISIGRRDLKQEHPKLKNIIVDFDQLSIELQKTTADDVYCCLGTTIKKAGSQQQFRKVDYDYVIHLAKWAESNAKRMMIVSAIGADADSKIFYSRVKGEVERNIQKLQINEVHIFRPSLLLGERQEFRLGERISAGLMLLARPVFSGNWSKYHPIEAAQLARAMYCAACSKKEGINFYEYPHIIELVKGKNC